jgi:hypothetical protein
VYVRWVTTEASAFTLLALSLSYFLSLSLSLYERQHFSPPYKGIGQPLQCFLRSFLSSLACLLIPVDGRIAYVSLFQVVRACVLRLLFLLLRTYMQAD